jgi:O-antigen ligase
MLLLVYIATMAFSLIYTSDFVNGLVRLKKQMALAMILILIETVSSPLHARNCLRAFSFGGAVLACIGIYQGLAMHIDRPPTLWYPVHAGQLLMFSATVSPLLKFAQLFIFIVLIFALYLNGTRGAWVAVAVVLFVVPFILKNSTPVKIALYAAILLVAAVLLFHSPYGKKKLTEAVNDVHLYQRSQSETSLGFRFEMWKASAKIFMNNPILGVGIGGWEKEMRSLVERGQAPPFLLQFNQTHNIYFDALSTRGVIGLLAFMALLIYPVMYAWNQRGEQVELFRNIVIFTGIAFMVAGLTDTLTYIRWSFISYIGLTGVGLALLFRHAGCEEKSAKTA